MRNTGGEQPATTSDDAAPRVPASTATRDPRADERARDYDAYQALLTLWASENPIKTNKLQVLLAVNALLVSGLQVSGKIVDSGNWLVYLTGALFSAIWTLSIGRTALFQEIWQMKLTRLQHKWTDDPRFQVLDTRQDKQAAPVLLRRLGFVPSRLYLLFSPLAFAAGWVMLLIAASLR
jgi:hypothetical protein